MRRHRYFVRNNERDECVKIVLAVMLFQAAAQYSGNNPHDPNAAGLAATQVWVSASQAAIQSRPVSKEPPTKSCRIAGRATPLDQCRAGGLAVETFEHRNSVGQVTANGLNDRTARADHAGYVVKKVRCMVRDDVLVRWGFGMIR